MNIRAKDFGNGRPLLRQKRPRRPRGEGLDNFEIPRDESRRSDMRDEDRHRLSGATFPVTYRGGRHDVEVVNLSGGGAMIACSLKPNLAEHLDLHLGQGESMECVVRWVKDGRVGLEFAHETQLRCPEALQAEVLAQVIEQSFADEVAAQPQTYRGRPENRAVARHPLIWGGELLYGPSRWKVRLRNVSESGALLECDRGPRVGAEVLLDLDRAGSVSATVTWLCGDHLGLKFDEPFDMKRLAKSKPRVAPPTWLRPAYLEDAVSERSAWDDAWSRMSIQELQEELEGFLRR